MSPELKQALRREHELLEEIERMAIREMRLVGDLEALREKVESLQGFVDDLRRDREDENE